MIYCQCWLRYRPSYVYKMMWDELIFTPESFVEKWLLLECFCTEECWRLFVDLYLCTQKAQVLAVRLWARGTAQNICVVFPPKSLGLPVITSHLKLCYFHLNRVDLHFGDSPPWQSVINTNFMKASRYLNYEHVVKFFNSNFLEQISNFWMTILCPHA